MVSKLVALSVILVALTAPVPAQVDPEPTQTAEPSTTTIMVPVTAGSELREAPDHESRLLAILPGTMRSGISWQYPWVQLRFGDLIGWVDSESPAVDPGSVPLDADLHRLARALGHLDLHGRSGQSRLGQLSLYTDVDNQSLIAYLDQLARQVAGVYSQHYGLEPASPAREAVVLFAAEESYRLFERAESGLDHTELTGHAAGGVVALFVGKGSERELARTLTHELCHLLNLRIFGREMPPWLDEGMAEELALSRITRDGRLVPGRLNRSSIMVGPRLHLYGPLAWLNDLLDRERANQLLSLPELQSLDRQQFFHSDEGPLYYALSSFWVHYLIGGYEKGLDDRFRSYLASLKGGAGPGPEALSAALGCSLEELGADFSAWLRQLPGRLGVPETTRRILQRR
jgi:hypothetical protein